MVELCPAEAREAADVERGFWAEMGKFPGEETGDEWPKGVDEEETSGRLIFWKNLGLITRVGCDYCQEQCPHFRKVPYRSRIVSGYCLQEKPKKPGEPQSRVYDPVELRSYPSNVPLVFCGAEGMPEAGDTWVGKINNKFADLCVTAIEWINRMKLQ
jgi:hypothetical protein